MVEVVVVILTGSGDVVLLLLEGGLEDIEKTI